METSFSYTEKEVAYFSSDERKWITKIRRMAEKFPNQVVILKQPEDNDGCIYAKLPVECMKINLISHRQLSDEERLAAAERLKNARKTLSRSVETEQGGEDDEDG